MPLPLSKQHGWCLKGIILPHLDTMEEILGLDHICLGSAVDQDGTPECVIMMASQQLRTVQCRTRVVADLGLVLVSTVSAKSVAYSSVLPGSDCKLLTFLGASSVLQQPCRPDII